jgi:hypothetical protein
MEIEKNIPMMEHNHHRSKHDEIKETIFAMEIGDSVFFDVHKEAARFRSRAANYLKTMPKAYYTRDFKLRTVEGGWRIWRTK